MKWVAPYNLTQAKWLHRSVSYAIENLYAFIKNVSFCHEHKLRAKYTYAMRDGSIRYLGNRLKLEHITGCKYKAGLSNI